MIPAKDHDYQDGKCTACGAEEQPVTSQIFAMDTVMDFAVYGENAQAALTAASQEINALEQRLSRTRAGSEISTLNETGSAELSDETVQRVTALLEKRQYIPSMAGILLARNSSGIIGVFVNDHPKYEGHTLRDGFLASVLLPLFVCEASWSLGENVYAAIYGRMGTEQSAAMTLTAPIQGLAIGALCGLSQAAGVIVGKRLGGEDYDGAYRAAKRLMVYGAVGASVLCAARCRAT